MSSIDNSNTGENESIEALKILIKKYQTLNNLHHQKITAIYELSIALRDVYSCGIIHCNVKPSNILFDRNIHVKLDDFENSCILGSTEQNPINCAGSMKFMAPELIRES